MGQVPADGAVRHVVLLRFVDEAPAGTAATIAASLRELPEQIPEIATYHVGTDLGINDGNHDLLVVGDFADADAYRVYRDHPAHRRIIDEQILPVLADRAAIQTALYPTDLDSTSTDPTELR